ncbi:protein-glutamate methylesterase/protein-glutamine glutaminase [Aliikangiella sp. IMCC44359]|uniref:protein-glutamate methylesterase/protein-glutamine glutaminase n=1 Tax=Aliikangiella sp. IMCC44359 TaxID=3459125 RepID=UPI00403B1F84
MKKVMVIDDSAVVRQVLTEIINESDDLQVYATAIDPIFALEKMKSEWPDVIVLDIEMPRMDGLTFLEKVMKEKPTPVIICSSLAQKGTELTLKALSLGAIEVITKPQLGIKTFLNETKKDIRNIVRACAIAKLGQNKVQRCEVLPSFEKVKGLTQIASTTDKITAIGCSTGGTQALEVVLQALPKSCPGIVVVQHMPEKFTKSFAERLNSLCHVEVIEARSGDRIIPGRVIIAPGGRHLEVAVSGAQYITKVFSGPYVNRHCPSVDVLFRSVAKQAGRNAKGVIMTGMGNDGANGLLDMQRNGALTIAQDEASSVVFGMPKEAIKLGAATKIVGLDEIAGLIAK